MMGKINQFGLGEKEGENVCGTCGYIYTGCPDENSTAITRNFTNI